MRCNGGTSAALNAAVPAGGNVTAKWKQWTHQQSPVMVWMYKCPGDFGSCGGSGRSWFKIDQEGLTAPPLAGNNWGTGKIYKDKKCTSKIPASLAPGKYFIRHELLALHTSNSPQFYPECAQLTVTGGGSRSPGGDYLASIPGYAPQSHPGIRVCRPTLMNSLRLTFQIDIYSSKATSYSIPGPKVWRG
jgi:hypothetical protein